MIKTLLRTIVAAFIFILLLYAGLRIAPKHDATTVSVDHEKQAIDSQEATIDIVQFTLDGVTFRIPKNRLNSQLRQDKYIPNEIRKRFSILAPRPDFLDPFVENSKMSEALSRDTTMIDVEIERYCGAAPNPKIALQARCNLSGGMQANYDAHGWSKGPTQNKWYFAPGTGPAPPIRTLVISGMTYQGYKINHPKSDNIKAAELIYKGTTKHGHLQFAECEILLEKDDHSCKIYVPWSDRFDLKFTIPEALLPQWQAIYEVIVATVESYVVTSDTPMPSPELNVVVFPQTR